MLKANTRPLDDHRAVLAILGYLRGDRAQLDHVMGQASGDPQGAAGLILALTESAAVCALQASDDAEDQLGELALILAGKLAAQEG